MFKICIVEDEKDLRDLLAAYLQKEGYDVGVFASGEAALGHVADNVHLWMLDIMLPGEISGYDILKQIRQKSATPAIFISARNQEIDRVMGLELGSDDYIVKPFSPREVVLRVSNILRRVYGEQTPQADLYGHYEIYLEKRLVLFEGSEVDLTSKEMDLLTMLIQNKNQAFKREQILNHIWGSDYFGSDRVVDDLVKRLRKKMPLLEIETIYGYGYRLK